MRSPSIIALAVATVAAATTTVAQRGPAQPPLVNADAMQKISDHVYEIPDNSVGLVPNIGIIVGSRATLVVDTGLGARNGQIVVQQVDKVGKRAELYLVTTHIHPEHDLGAHAFPAQTKMIRAQAQVAEIAETGLDLAKRFSGFSPMTAELLQGAEFRKADVTFTDEHRLDLGGVRVRLIAMGYNHTRGDTAIFVEPDNVLFAGDVSMTALPNVAAPATVGRWIASQDRFTALQPKQVVPSHGPMGDLAMIARNKDFLVTVQQRAAALKKQGVALDDAVKTIQTELEPRFGASPRTAGTIRTAYVEVP